MILTLTAGMQVTVPVDPADVDDYVQLIRQSWGGSTTIPDLVIGSPDGVTDWVRLEHIAAVRVAPAYQQEEGA
jgi:hypothetical protein